MLVNVSSLFVICISNYSDVEHGYTGADPGFFLGGGAPLRNGVTDWWGKQILKANTRLQRRGEVRISCILPLELGKLICQIENQNDFWIACHFQIYIEYSQKFNLYWGSVKISDCRAGKTFANGHNTERNNLANIQPSWPQTWPTTKCQLEPVLWTVCRIGADRNFLNFLSFTWLLGSRSILPLHMCIDYIIDTIHWDVKKRLERVQKGQQIACLSFIQIEYTKDQRSRISLFRGLKFTLLDISFSRRVSVRHQFLSSILSSAIFTSSW